jgi:hypothetical protein
MQQVPAGTAPSKTCRRTLPGDAQVSPRPQLIAAQRKGHCELSCAGTSMARRCPGPHTAQARARPHFDGLTSVPGGRELLRLHHQRAFGSPLMQGDLFGVWIWPLTPM